jgi:hypothetical protein
MHSLRSSAPPVRSPTYQDVQNALDRAYAILHEISERYKTAYQKETAPLVQEIVALQSMLPPRPVIVENPSR